MSSIEQDVILNRKAYIKQWRRKDPPHEEMITYWFCEFAANAAFWSTRALAEQARDILNIGVSIPSVIGGRHTLRNFDIEEVSSNKFLIFCTGPFIHSENGESNQSIET